MRWTLNRKFTLLMLSVLLGFAVFFIAIEKRIGRMSILHQELHQEWDEFSIVTDLDHCMEDLAGMLITEGLTEEGGYRNEVENKFAECLFLLHNLSEIQETQNLDNDNFQQEELSAINQLTAAIVKTRDTWYGLHDKDSAPDLHMLNALHNGINGARKHLRRFLSAATQEVEADVKEIGTAVDEINSFLLVMLALLVVIISLQCFGFFFGVTRPIRQLHNAVLRVRRRDYSDLPTPIFRDELGDLAEGFAEMAHEIDNFTSDLEVQIEQGTRDLIRSQKMAAIGRLSAGIAHEINNPLASISACAEGLIRRFENGSRKDNDENMREYLVTIRDEVHRCKDIIGKLLDFSRQRPCKREQIDARVLAEDTMRLVRHNAEKLNCRLISRLPEQPLALVCDGDQIRQVLLNILLNAMDACRDGGEITLLLHGKEQRIVYEIVDDGCGMESGDLERIFEPFFSRKNGTEGTGLGLAISHGIIESHNGEILAESDGPGCGSRFSVLLPRAPQASDSSGMEQESEASGGE